jgi:uncharacterized membrane protein HdeD (DUF308 family)
MAFDMGSNGTVQRVTGALLPFAGVWWLIALRGLAGIVFGVFAIFMPGVAIASMLFVFAAYMLVDGVFALAAAITAARRGRRWGLLILESVLNLLVGLIALIWPALTVTFLVILVALWALVTGAAMIGAAFQHRQRGQGWLICSGIISILFGLVLAIAPIIGAVVLTWWLGIYALIFGVVMVIFAFRLRTVTAE